MQGEILIHRNTLLYIYFSDDFFFVGSLLLFQLLFLCCFFFACSASTFSLMRPSACIYRGFLCQIMANICPQGATSSFSPSVEGMLLRASGPRSDRILHRNNRHICNGWPCGAYHTPSYILPPRSDSGYRLRTWRMLFGCRLHPSHHGIVSMCSCIHNTVTGIGVWQIIHFLTAVKRKLDDFHARESESFKSLRIGICQKNPRSSTMIRKLAQVSSCSAG